MPIAHEINNPLAFVLNNVFTVQSQLAWLAEHAGSDHSSVGLVRINKARARLEDMKQGLERVKELVVDLRTFSRLDEGRFKTVDITESINSVLRFLHHRMKDRILVEKDYGPVRTLSCYAGPLNQVLMNVIANAVDAVESEGTIAIRTTTEDGMFIISIRDCGVGIPDAIRGRIFEPFFTTKPVGQGTGLGLAISYGIIQAHRGRIEVVSKEGQGSEFVICIPLNLEETNG